MNESTPKKNFVLELKKAMARKHGNQHPEKDVGDAVKKVNKLTPFVNKPQKKVTGRGR